jgi:hypothetical protein
VHHEPFAVDNINVSRLLINQARKHTTRLVSFSGVAVPINEETCKGFARPVARHYRLKQLKNLTSSERAKKISAAAAFLATVVSTSLAKTLNALL